MVQDAEITVIIPIYNVAEYLDKCISSIQGQTYGRLQIVLVDDGSTDDSGSICDRYKEQDSRIVVIHKGNEGLVRARKTGLSCATGKYVCYVDGDDWIEPDLIECLAADMERTEADLVVSGHYCDTESGSQKIQGIFAPGLYDSDAVIPVMLCADKFYKFGISQFIWAKLFRKEILWDVQMRVDDRIRCGEDVAVTYPYILRSHKVYCSGYAGYHYWQRMDSMTNRFDVDESVRNKILLGYLKKNFDNSGYSDILYRQLNQYAKNLLLARQIGCFDSLDESMILKPYGGISADARLIIYGAGKLGQSVYCYLKECPSIEIVDWLDRNHAFFSKMRYKVHSPEKLKSLDAYSYDFIIVAVIDQEVADGICVDLMNMGIKREKMKCIDKDFIDEGNCILDTL